MAILIRQRQQIALRRLPGVFSGIMYRGYIPISHGGDGRQQVNFVAEGNLTFLLHHLERQDHIASFVFRLPR